MRSLWLKSSVISVFAGCLALTATASPALARPSDEARPGRPEWSSRPSGETQTQAPGQTRQSRHWRPEGNSPTRPDRGWRAQELPPQTAAQTRNRAYRPQEQSRVPDERRPSVNGWRYDNGRATVGTSRSYDRRVDSDHRHWSGTRWDRDCRRDSRYDWRSYRNRNHHYFRADRYRAPTFGYRYAPLSIGFVLGRPFYTQSYWISDPWRYRLPSPYGPYRWVRYYDDVLLVDTFNGEVIDVIRDFFW